MLTHEVVNGDYIIQNSFYKILFSREHGGTIRSFEFKGFDMRVTREGCEYWEPDSPNHYEQEYGSTINMEVIDKNQNFIVFEVKASLVSPQLKTEGGMCTVRWLFRRDSPIIYTDYQIFPTRPYIKGDRYTCFDPDAYCNYSIMADDLDSNEIGADGTHVDDRWWYRTGNNVKWGSISNNRFGFLLKGSSRLTSSTVFKSESMIELKMDESSDLGLSKKPVYSFYLPYEIGENDFFDDSLFRETRLKCLMIQSCNEMKEKGDENADWFKRTLKEHNRGIWFLKNKDKYLKENDKVLDIAGGIGAWGAYLIYVNKTNLDYTNIDINPIRIETTKKIFEELEIKGNYIVHDWNEFDVRNNDVALCFGATYDLDDRLFRQANQSLKAGGFFIFEVVEKSSNREGYKYTLDMPEIETKMRDAGFEILQMEYCAKYDSFNDIAVVGRKLWSSDHIKNHEEYVALVKLTQEIIDEDDSDLITASKLSDYCKKTIFFPAEMPKGRRWYSASSYESLTKWKIGNCLNYAKSLIGLADSTSINGRMVWISGKVDGYDDIQGHALCELKIDGRWVLFDAMYGVPFLSKPDAKTPSAYDCWKNPDHYIDAINPEYYGFSRKFWKQIWFDFHIYDDKSINEVGEDLFMQQWYSTYKGGN